VEKEPFLQYDEVLVTGGTGFVGAHVCRALVARGFLPRLLVRAGSEEKIPEDVRSRCRVTLGDATIYEDVENAAQGTDAVIHLVGIIREVPSRGITFERLHVEATRHAVRAARRWRIERFVHMSALGARPGGPTRYFDTKGRAEEIVRTSGLAWTILRPSVIFGPGDRFVNVLARAVRLAPFIPVPGDGSFRLQPVYAGDVAAGFAEAVVRPDLAGRAFDVGGPERFSYDELLDAIAGSAGRRARKVHVPLCAVRRAVRLFQRFERFPVTEEQLAMLLEESVCDHEPFFETFGFEPTSLSRYLAGGREEPRPGAGKPAEAGGSAPPELPKRRAP